MRLYKAATVALALPFLLGGTSFAQTNVDERHETQKQLKQQHKVDKAQAKADKAERKAMRTKQQRRPIRRRTRQIGKQRRRLLARSNGSVAQMPCL